MKLLLNNVLFNYIMNFFTYFSWCVAMPTLWHSQMKVLSFPGGQTLTVSWAQGTRPIRCHLPRSP